MSRRLFTILLAAIAAIAIAGYYLHARLSAADHSFSKLVEWAPGNSTFIGYIDIAALRKEPLIAHLASLLAPVELDRDYAEFIGATGFDYQRDLDGVVIAANAGQRLAIAEGRFDQKKIEEYALRSGRVDHERDRATYAMKSMAPGQKIFLTFLNDNHIAVAEGGDVAEHLAKAPAPLDLEMRQMLARVDGSPVFAAWKITGPPTPASGGATSLISMALQSLRGIDLAIQPDGDRMLISLEGECEDSLHAQKLSGDLEFLRTILPGALGDPKVQRRISTEDAALAARLIQAAVISSDGERVRLILTVTPSMIGGTAPGK